MDVEFLSQNWHLFLALAFLLALLFIEPLILKIAGISSIGPLQVTHLVNSESASILDVSSVKEYEEGHIPNALNVPLSDFKSAGDDIVKNKENPVIVSCRTGNRAKAAAKKLTKTGVAQVYILTGGNTAWEKENLPMTRNS